MYVRFSRLPLLNVQFYWFLIWTSAKLRAIIVPHSSTVYATTAANPTESSYACYFDSKLETYLGDVYSVKWMENVDKVGVCVCVCVCIVRARVSWGGCYLRSYYC